MATAHDPIHPGEVLTEEFLIPLGISQHPLAKTIDVAPTPIGEILHDEASSAAGRCLADRLAVHHRGSRYQGF